MKIEALCSMLGLGLVLYLDPHHVGFYFLFTAIYLAVCRLVSWTVATNRRVDEIADKLRELR